MTDIEVAAAGRRDVRELAPVMARAFFADPVMMWMLPDSSSRMSRLQRMFAALIRWHFLRGRHADVARTDVIGAGALWDPPGGRRADSVENLMMAPLMLLTVGRRMSAAQQLVELMEENHPEEPHWYLGMIGSDPTVRGAGYGKALLASRLETVDAEHAPAYLEATKRDTVPYYIRFGFELTGEIKLPDGGPSLWPMWRQPR